jgi:glycerate kinase
MKLQSMPVLIAPDAFSATLRAPVVAAAIGRGLERAGVTPLPDLCPLAGGGRGTIEVLLPVLGGQTGDGFALVEDGGTALVELGPTPAQTGRRIAAAVAAGAEVVLLCAAGAGESAGDRALAAIEDGGGLRGAALVVLCDVRTPFEHAPGVFGPQKGADPGTVARLRERLDALAATWPRDPRGRPMTGAAGGLAGGLWAALGATLEPGAPWILEALEVDARMRAAQAVIVGEGRIDQQTLAGKLAGELATRARQAGVPCHAIVGTNALDPFGARILDLQTITEARTLEEITAAAEALVPVL